MPDDRIHPSFPGDPGDDALREALRALPLAQPNASALPALKARLARRRGGDARKRWLSLAAAAAVCALALAPILREGVSPAAPVAAADPALAALIAQNQVYESALRRASFGGAPTGRDALAGAELEDLIGMLDLELSATGDAAAARDLWQQRLVLMQELATVRARGGGELVAAGDPRVLPANWQVN